MSLSKEQSPYYGHNSDDCPSCFHNLVKTKTSTKGIPWHYHTCPCPDKKCECSFVSSRRCDFCLYFEVHDFSLSEWCICETLGTSPTYIQLCEPCATTTEKNGLITKSMQYCGDFEWCTIEY